MSSIVRAVLQSVVRIALSSIVLASVAFLPAPPALAAPAPPAPSLAAEAYVLVDHDSGEVLAAKNERVLRPPASITKLLTALTVAANTELDDMVPVTGPGPQAMPPLKIDTRQGEQWRNEDLMRALLMVSANDAGLALAEHASGSLDGFSKDRYAAAADLGLMDKPWLNDPSGLDDEFSHRGGDLISARDMAIIGRAALEDPEVRQLVDDTRYEFTGPDLRSRHMLNHNGLLKTYDGAIGMKTGYTKKANQTLVAAAERNGRTMLVVVMGANRAAPVAATLMDQGFATTPGTRGTDRLPEPAQVRPKPAVTPLAIAAEESSSMLPLALGGLLVAGVLFRRRQVAQRNATPRT